MRARDEIRMSINAEGLGRSRRERDIAHLLPVDDPLVAFSPRRSLELGRVQTCVSHEEKRAARVSLSSLSTMRLNHALPECSPVFGSVVMKHDRCRTWKRKIGKQGF